VADSALYTAEGLQELSGILWVTRVPETIKEAQEAIKGTDKEEMEESGIQGYRYREMESNYAGIPQRWLVVYSLAEKKLRETLAAQGLTVKDQQRRPIKTPTIRWVFRKFEDVLILYVYESDRLKLIQCELRPDHITIIKCLGKHVEKMYFFDY